MRQINYNRQKAVAYAKEWAHKRNPRYLDFEDIGGDCTNFASQCIYAGCGVMNYTKTFGWYYISPENRAPAWTSVRYLYDFLISNKGAGPYAADTTLDLAQPGDVIQLGNDNGEFYHSPVVVSVQHGMIYVAAHTFDTYMRPLDNYVFDNIRLLHIIAARG